MVYRHSSLACARRPLAVLLATALAGLSAQAVAQVASTSEPSLPEVKVTANNDYEPSSEKTGSYTVRHSTSATGLNLQLKETPQSVSVVTRTQMDDFKLNSVNDVLANTTGIVVEKIETDRAYYTARGFDITNFQLDGVGIPFVFGNVAGDMDTAFYDRVEAIKGATGLISGSGNPSATINFVRKRPTAEFQASTSLTYGSWNDRRVETDISGPLTANKNLRARFVVVDEDKDSYLQRYSHNKLAYQGIVEADIGERTTLTVGHAEQQNKAKSPLWGALPLNYSDGSPTNYDVSTSTASNWSYWNIKTETNFAELAHQFDNGWQAKGTLTHTRSEQQSKLFYAYGTPDRATGLGLFSWPSRYDGHNEQTIVSLQANGPFMLGGRKHELVLGVSAAKSNTTEVSTNTASIGLPLPDIANWNGEFPEPAFNAGTTGGAFTDKYVSANAAVRLNPADNFKLILGANSVNVRSSGFSYGEDKARNASDITPYLGAVVDLSREISAYGSYTGIFNPQNQFDSSRKTLEPATGKSVELGLKSELFDKKLNASFAVFKSEQKNLADLAGAFPDGVSFYKGIDTFSRGYEMDLSGMITSRWQASAGYTRLSIRDAEGKDVRTYTPREVFNVSTSYKLPGMDNLKIGANLRWRGDTYRDQGGGVSTRQSSYALLDLMAKYDIDKHLSLAANIYNVTNEKYLNSLYWSQSFYGAPINGSVTLTWKY